VRNVLGDLGISLMWLLKLIYFDDDDVSVSVRVIISDINNDKLSIHLYSR
jgi:hypothetical protein